jgi:LysM repeat protein
MPNSTSRPSPYRRTVLAILVAGLVGATGVAAYQQGWFGSGSARQSPHRQRSGTIARASRARVPPPPDLVADTLASGRILPTKFESAAGKPRTQSRSQVVPIGFAEDDAPQAPELDDDPNDKVPPERQQIAGKPAESTNAASLKTDEPGLFSEGPLRDRSTIDKLIEDGNYVDAQHELSRWYWQKPGERERLLPQLNKMAKALYFSPQPNYYDPYVVKPGDQLRIVGQRYKLSWEYLARLNHVDAKKIRMGQKLKVVPGPFSAIVFLSRYELVVHLGGSFVKSYRVGVGRDGTSPIGTFTVKNKMVDPTYYGPEGIVPHDDPKNPLGERWIDIGDSFGIHGTIEPESIGKNESRGCIRMLNSEVEEVYDFLVIGSEVKIQK